jgi:hypothetical protein
MTALRMIFKTAAVCSVLVLAAGCSDVGTSFKQTFTGKPTPTPDMPERPKLAMPPSTAQLPVPGQTANTASGWRPQSQQPQQTAAQETKSDSGGSWYSSLFGSSDDKKTQ